MIDEQYTKWQVILHHNVPMRIVRQENNWKLEPNPLEFDRSKKIIIITVNDVEPDSELRFPHQKADSLQFFRYGENSTDLLATNVFNNEVENTEFFTLKLYRFYEEPKLRTLELQFNDQSILLRDINAVVTFEDHVQQYRSAFNVTGQEIGVLPLRNVRRRRQILDSDALPVSSAMRMDSWLQQSVMVSTKAILYLRQQIGLGIQSNSRHSDRSAYYKGKKANTVYTPQISPYSLDHLNEQLMLLQVVIHEGKKLYGWFWSLFYEKNSNPPILKESQTGVTTFVTGEQISLWQETLDKIEKQLTVRVNLGVKETDLRWAWHSLEDRKEEFKDLSLPFENSLDKVNAFTENLQALMIDLNNIFLPSQKNIEFNNKSSNASVFWRKQSFLKAQLPAPMCILVPAMNDSLSLSVKCHVA